jgi:hypothetical protein
MKEDDNSKDFDSSNWKEDLATNQTGEHCEQKIMELLLAFLMCHG